LLIPEREVAKTVQVAYRSSMEKSQVVIEDDEAIRESMFDLLSMEGYTVLGFSNGQEAMNGLDALTNPCLILLDWMMPVMDGAEFLQARQSLQGPAKSAPVIVVSAVAGKIADAPTASGFLRKPLDLDVLLDIVAKHCPAK
jgi:two-component system chemotaxis response regulator CheY